MASPKGAVVLGPWFKTEFYSNAGYGLHSNDIRGATITVDPTYNLTPLDRVPLLVRGGRKLVSAPKRLRVSLAHLRFLCSISTPNSCLSATRAQPSRPSRRVGVEWVNQYKLVPWLSFDLDVAYTKASFTDFDLVGDRIPGAPAWVGSASIVLGNETGWFGALKARYFGPRPLIEDDSVRSLLAHFQRPRWLSVRQRPAAATRCAQSLQHANQSDRILLPVTPAGRADRRYRRAPRAPRRAACGAVDYRGSVLT